MEKFLHLGLDYVDGFLDNITSYRLVLYFLILLGGWSTLLGFAGQLPYEGWEIMGSFLWLTAVCWALGLALSSFLNVYRNRESDFITALILGLILSPASSLNDFLVLAAAAAVAVVSKFVLTVGKRHIFNPAALGAYLVGLIFHSYASWWVGTAILIPLTIAGGLLILRKMNRFIMVLIFEAIYIGALVTTNLSGNTTAELGHIVWIGLSATPIFFFSYIMLTEPLTSPRLLNKCIIYAAVVGTLYSFTQLHFAPEEALLVGNLVAFVMAPTARLVMSLKHKKKEADGIYSFSFTSPKKLAYLPGQYLEWTLPASGSDSRGNRRYLTLASSPTENEYSFAIKIPPGLVSSFKRHVAQFKTGQHLLAGSLAGSFTLPSDPGKKIAFIAGGIGITPYRSMVKYLVDTSQSRDMRLFYSANKAGQHAYKDLFKTAQKNGLKTLYIASQDASRPTGMQNGVIDQKVIASFTPDWKERVYYVSGPNSFVKYISQTLRDMGVKNSAIKSDYFPGYG